MSHSNLWLSHTKGGLSPFPISKHVFFFSFPMPSLTWSAPCIDQNYSPLGEKKKGKLIRIRSFWGGMYGKKTEKCFLQWQSNAADFPLGKRICALPQDLKSSVYERFLAAHSCCSTAPCRPNGSLCAFGHITHILSHNPSTLSLPYPLSAPSHPSIQPLRSRSVRSELTLGKAQEVYQSWLHNRALNFVPLLTGYVLLLFSQSVSRSFFCPADTLWVLHNEAFLTQCSRCYKTTFSPPLN